ncbi:MAG TPA: DNA-3-methyladenine glycosylase [Stenomitos sp.]
MEPTSLLDLPRLDPRDLAAHTVEAARRLLGCVLVRRDGADVLAGRIVETEAYRPDDPASHSFRGPSARNASMFGSPGRAYVYLIYGRNHCLNVVTEGAGTGAAVLIRALEPLAGMEAMRERRGSPHLTNGPGRLCQAMGIDRSLDGADLLGGDRLYLLAAPPLPDEAIRATGRIGISKAVDWPWRFVVAGNAHLSRK